MPRLARAVAVGFAHHITQRGNNRQDVFFVDDDRRVYLELSMSIIGTDTNGGNLSCMLCSPLCSCYSQSWVVFRIMSKSARFYSAWPFWYKMAGNFFEHRMIDTA